MRRHAFDDEMSSDDDVGEPPAGGEGRARGAGGARGRHGRTRGAKRRVVRRDFDDESESPVREGADAAEEGPSDPAPVEAREGPSEAASSAGDVGGELSPRSSSSESEFDLVEPDAEEEFCAEMITLYLQRVLNAR